MLKQTILILKLLLYLVMGGFCLPAYANDSQTDRDLWLRASYLYNFTKFVKWPDVSTNEVDDLTFCVVDNFYFTIILIKTVSTHTIAEKNIRVKNVSETDLLTDCHLVYIHQETPSLNRQYLKKVDKAPQLTVGNAESFIVLGGIVRFQMINNKLKFEINEHRANDAGLEIDSQLLRLGRGLDE